MLGIKMIEPADELGPMPGAFDGACVGCGVGDLPAPFRKQIWSYTLIDAGIRSAASATSAGIGAHVGRKKRRQGTYAAIGAGLGNILAGVAGMLLVPTAGGQALRAVLSGVGGVSGAALGAYASKKNKVAGAAIGSGAGAALASIGTTWLALRSIEANYDAATAGLDLFEM
jgi:hypothetical protein